MQEERGKHGALFLVALNAVLREREKKEPTGNRLFFSLPNRWEGGAGLPYPTNALGGR